METVTACVKRDSAWVVLRDGEEATLHGWRCLRLGRGVGGEGSRSQGREECKGQTVGALKPS